MKLTKLFITAFVILCASCAKQDKPKVIEIDSYAYEGTLTGKPLEFDTIVGSPGRITVFGDNLLVNLYQSKNSVMMLDENFKISGLGFSVGHGPEEILSTMGSFGQLLPDQVIAVHDYNRNEIAVTNGEDFTTGLKKIKLPKIVGKISPRRILQLNDGRYVMSKSRNYGLATCDANDSTVDWPLGLTELDSANPNIDIPSQFPRPISYARGRGIVGEIYGHIPAVILHNEDGSIHSVLKFGEIPDVRTINIASERAIGSFMLGEKYIYVLLGDKDDTEMNVAIIDYDGNGVAKITIDPAASIAVNENKKYMAVTGRMTDEIMIYDLSSIPGLEL